jgi:hypothetical protein
MARRPLALGLTEIPKQKEQTMEILPDGKSGTVGFVQRELDRIAEALRETQTTKRYAELYAAQQALSWAIEPQGFAAPLDVIRDGRIVPPTEGTQGD